MAPEQFGRQELENTLSLGKFARQCEEGDARLATSKPQSQPLGWIEQGEHRKTWVNEECEQKDCDREKKPPQNGTSGFTYPVSVRRSAVQPCPLRERMSRSQRSPPPLPPAHDSRIVQCHFPVEPVNTPAHTSQSQAHFGLFASDQAVPVAVDLRQCFGAHECISTATQGVPCRGVPLKVAHPVVNGSIGVALATATAYHCAIGLGNEIGTRCINPSRHDLTVAVGELHEPCLGLECKQALQPRIASSCGGKGGVHVEPQHLGPHASGHFHGSVCGS